jgi:hypothetical protein
MSALAARVVAYEPWQSYWKWKVEVQGVGVVTVVEERQDTSPEYSSETGADLTDLAATVGLAGFELEEIVADAVTTFTIELEARRKAYDIGALEHKAINEALANVAPA